MCEMCLVKPKVTVKGAKYVCGECNPGAWFTGGYVEKVFIRSYGLVSKKRIGEVLRRKILPVKPTEEGVSYYVGRKMENGKVAEVEPRY